MVRGMNSQSERQENIEKTFSEISCKIAYINKLHMASVFLDAIGLTVISYELLRLVIIDIHKLFEKPNVHKNRSPYSLVPIFKYWKKERNRKSDSFKYSNPELYEKLERADQMASNVRKRYNESGLRPKRNVTGHNSNNSAVIDKDTIHEIDGFVSVLNDLGLNNKIGMGYRISNMFFNVRNIDMMIKKLENIRDSISNDPDHDDFL